MFFFSLNRIIIIIYILHLNDSLNRYIHLLMMSVLEQFSRSTVVSYWSVNGDDNPQRRFPEVRGVRVGGARRGGGLLADVIKVNVGDQVRLGCRARGW